MKTLFEKDKCRILFSFIAFTIGIFLVIQFISCKDTQTSPPTDIVFPSTNVSFSQHVGPLFQQSCTYGGCHDGSNSHVNLIYPGSYHNLINFSPVLVVPSNGSLSSLYLWIHGDMQDRMPLYKPSLTTNQVNGVKTWIDEGAKPN